MKNFGKPKRGLFFQHTRGPQPRCRLRGRSLAIEPLETRTLLDAAGLNPHGMFPGEMFEVGEYADDMVLGDFNGDGKADIAVTNRYTNLIAVRLGRGDGTLGEASHFSVGAQPASIAAADFDSDGDLDLVTGNVGSISLLLGHGDGTFEAQPILIPFSGAEFFDLEVADVNEDGTAEILAADHAKGRVFVFPGRGDGTFRDHFEFAVGEGPWDVSLGDLNHDGHLDIVTANALGNSVSVLLGQGGGDFQAEMRFDVGRYPASVELADLNGDGWTDLIVANHQDYNISVLFGAGDGRFTGESQYKAGNSPTCPFSYDLDRDGHLDLLIPQFGSNAITVLLNQADGTFTDAGTLLTGYIPQEIVADDMNSDGRADLVVLCWGADSVAIHLANDDGSIQFPAHHLVDHDPHSVVLADFNLDGHLDVASANGYASSISVRLGRGDGVFGEENRYPLAGYFRSPVVGDFNEDGFPDLVAVNGNAGVWVLLLGRGDGTFEVVPYKTREQTRSLAAGDFDNDGHLDLIGVVDRTDGPEASFSLHRGNGLGGFHCTLNVPLTSEEGPEPSALVDDLNGDGYADLVVAPVDGQILVFLGRGNGTFNDPERLAEGILPASVALADFNEDTRPDIFGLQDDSLVVLLNRGDGGYDTLTGVSTDSWRTSSTVMDFNRDGHADVACYINNPSQGQIYLGYGDGTFAPPAAYATSGSVYPMGYFMAAGDLNEDGWSDLVLPDGWSASVSVSLQNPQAGPQPHGITLGGAARLVTSEEGATASFKVTLDNQPTAQVTINLSSSNMTEGTVWPAFLTFTPENWSTPQVVTITGLNDDLIDGPIAFSILLDPTSSEDPVYTGMAPQDVHVVNIDDELTLHDLGVIDFQEFQGLGLSAGVLGYSFQTMRSGLLTAEAIAQTAGELVELSLFDAGRVDMPLIHSSSTAGKARVEWAAREGRQYVLLASGTDTAANLRLANLLQRDGSRVTVYGTDRDDAYCFSAAGPFEVVVNGLAYSFDRAQVDKFVISGGQGADRMELYDSPGDDALRRTVQCVSMTGPGYAAEASDFETVIARADAGGLDVAQLDDSPGNDAFVGTPAWSEMTGQTFSIRVEAFEAVHAYHRQRIGNDTAVLHGSGADDKLKSTADWVILRGTDSSYLVRAKFFTDLSAGAGSGGNDLAVFCDSPYDDMFRFEGAGLISRVEGGGRTHRAAGFNRVIAYGGEGDDIAFFTDLPGQQNDVFYLRSHKAELAAGAVNATARGFDKVLVEANQEGFDVARIYDTAGDDHLEVAGNTARLYRRDDNGLHLVYEVIAAERVKAYRSTGNDTTDIQDHTLELALYGWDE